MGIDRATLTAAAGHPERRATDARRPPDDLAALGEAIDATAIVAVTDVKGHILEANDRFCAISGYAREELVGQDHRILKSGVHARATYREMYRTIGRGRVWRGEFCNRARNGSLYWIDATIIPRRDADGKICTYKAIGVDITSRKRTQEALARSEALHRSTLMALGDGVVVQDAGGRIISCNPSAQRILGRGEDALLGRAPTDTGRQAIHEDGRAFPDAEHPAMVALATGRSQRNVVMGLRGTGHRGDHRGDRSVDHRVTWISINSEPIFEPGNPVPTAVVTSFSDITLRKQAQDVLAEAIAGIPDGFVVYDDDDRLLVCNDAYRQLYARSAEAMKPGARFEDIVRFGLRHGQYPEAGTTPEQQSAWCDERLRLHREPLREFLQHLPDGRWLQVREQRTPSGYMVGFRTDVTDIKRKTDTLQTIVDHFPGGILFIDADLNVAAFNDQLRAMLKLPPELFADGMPRMETFFRTMAARGDYGPGGIEDHVRERMGLIINPKAHVFERMLPNGRLAEVSGNPVPGGGFITTYLDITERRAAEVKLTASEREAREKSEVLQLTLAHMSQGLAMFDADGRLQVWNQRYAELYGISPDQLQRGTTIETIVAARRKEEVYGPAASLYAEEVRRAVARGEPYQATARLKNGRVIAVGVTPKPDGGWVATHEDITERERAAAQISHLAHHDGLTGLANRAEFNARAADALKRATAVDEVGILLVDLDRFKAVNDTLGHAAGDQLLQVVAARMLQTVRTHDLVARLGGDEFAILQEPRSAQRQSVVALAKRLIGVLATPYDLGGREATIGASIGIAVAPEHGTAVDQLLRNADVALYSVKAGGRNDCRVYDRSLDAQNQLRRMIEAELRDAIAADGLDLHYQPIVAVADRRVSAMEALVRWPHPTRGRMAPDQFIPIAEASGLIVPLGEWVIRRACRDAAHWPAGVRVSINVSPNHLRKRTVVATLTRALADARLSPERIEMEVTETVLLQQDEDILAELNALRELGVSIVLDDFGTGYSSLSHLRMFAFDKLKIDKSFVAEITERADCAAIVCAVAGLAHSLDMGTTAEGVETAEQLQLLEAAGCSHAQGWLFGKAQNAADTLALLTATADRPLRQLA